MVRNGTELVSNWYGIGTEFVRNLYGICTELVRNWYGMVPNGMEWYGMVRNLCGKYEKAVL